MADSPNGEDDARIPPDISMWDGVRTPEDFRIGGIAFMYNVLIARCGLKPEHAVLDIGCGHGAKAMPLASYLNGGSYCGFDIMPGAIQWCRESYGKHLHMRFDLAELASDWYKPSEAILQTADTYRFPYPDDSFDIAFALSVFTHLLPQQTANYMREVARVLKPGGRLYGSAYLVREGVDLHSADVQQDRLFEQLDGFYTIDKSAPSRGVAYDEDVFLNFVRRAGLTTSEVYFGRWANGIDMLGALQDGVVAIKPLKA